MAHDIFLSYATADDTLLAAPWADQKTWVRCFKVALKEAVDRELGRKSSASWFLDSKDLATGDELESEIKRALDDTKVFVALLSKGYFHPDSWCNLERKHFLDSLGSGAAQQRRVFGVLLDESSLSEWKEKFFDTVKAFPFYARDEADESFTRLGDSGIDNPFLTGIRRLAGEIAKRIEEFREDAPSGPSPADPPPVYKGTVYLAAAPGDMEESRAEIADALKRDGWKAVPEVNECHASPEQCETDAQATGTDSKVIAYVQILGTHPWTPGNYDRRQFDGFSKSGKPALVFRSQEIDLLRVKNEQHRAWLSTVNARSLPQIQAELSRKLNEILASKVSRPPAPPNNAFVTLCVSPPEHPTHGQTLLGTLQQVNVFAVLHKAETTLEDIFMNEDGLLAVFGNEPYERIEKLLLGWRQLLSKHRRIPGSTPPVGIYLTQPPPQDKRILINMTLPGLQVMNWDDAAGFTAFVNRIHQFANQRSALASQSTQAGPAT